MTHPHYIRAIRSTGAHAEWLPLLGPFQTWQSAWNMLRIVEQACQRHRLYKGCTFDVWRGKAGLRGALRLDVVVDAEWVAQVIERSER